MKHLAPVILFAIAMHYVFVAAFTTKVTEWSSAALIALVLGGAAFLWWCLPEDKR
jgi:small-conductance mechanosensitive channel